MKGRGETFLPCVLYQCTIAEFILLQKVIFSRIEGLYARWCLGGGGQEVR